MTRVFLSYSYDRDREFITVLKDDIKKMAEIDFLDPMGSLQFGAEIASEIRAQIENCDVFVSVIGWDRPNILLETGMAIGAGKNLLLIANSLDALPFNLRSLPVVLFSGDPKTDSSVVIRRLLELKSPRKERDIARMPVLDQLKAYRSDPRLFDSISPKIFEELVAELFIQQGYEVTMTSRTHDAGFDMVVRSPVDRRLIAVQVKKYSRQGRVSIAQVRELIGGSVLMDADVAVLVTSSSFTAGALALAAEVTRPKVALVTMERLLESSNVGELWQDAANQPLQSDRPPAGG